MPFMYNGYSYCGHVKVVRIIDLVCGTVETSGPSDVRDVNLLTARDFNSSLVSYSVQDRVKVKIGM